MDVLVVREAFIKAELREVVVTIVDGTSGVMLDIVENVVEDPLLLEELFCAAN
jgi:hypothetical protein